MLSQIKNSYTSILTFLRGMQSAPMLHRWCHPTSELYNDKCGRDTQLRKADLANYDNGADLIQQKVEMVHSNNYEKKDTGQ